MEEDFKRTDDHLEQLTKKHRYTQLWKFLHNSNDINSFIAQIDDEVNSVECREKKCREKTQDYRQLLKRKGELENQVEDLRLKTEKCTEEIYNLEHRKVNALVDSGLNASFDTGLGSNLSGEESLDQLEAILRLQEQKINSTVEENNQKRRALAILEETYDEMMLEEDVYGNKENQAENILLENNKKSHQSPVHNLPPLDHCTLRCTYQQTDHAVTGSVRVEDETYDIRILFGDGMFGQLETADILSNGKIISSLPVDKYLAFVEDPIFLFSEARQEASSTHFWLKHCTKLQSKFQCVNQSSKTISITFPSNFRIDIVRPQEYGIFSATPLQIEFSNDPPDFLKKPFYTLLELLTNDVLFGMQKQSSI